jgi:hypothetical protein
LHFSRKNIREMLAGSEKSRTFAPAIENKAVVKQKREFFERFIDKTTK